MPIEAIEQGRMAPPPPPSAKPFRGAGDFTLQFGRDSALPPPPAAAPEIAYTPAPPPTPQARMSSGATGLFSAPKPNYGDFDSGPAAPAGPGEFTRIIQGPPKDDSGSGSSASSYSSAPPPSAVAAPAPQPRSKTMPILFAVLALVVVGLLITVVVLMLKK